MNVWPSKDDLAALGYLAGWRLVRLLPRKVAYGLFQLGADYASRGGRGPEQLRKNLARVVGPENVTRELVRDSMRSYMRYWCEAFRLPSLHGDPALYAALKDGIEGLSHLDESLACGKGVVLALTHSGNWDMAGSFLVEYYGQFTTVAERLKPEVLFDAFVDFRTGLGFDVLPLTGGIPPFPRLKEVLADGGVVCLLGERDITRSGVSVDFFGEKTTMAAGPAALAVETGAALHAVSLWFTPDGWGMRCSPRIEVTDVQETTQRLADAYAEAIAQHPEDWHMLQPQWTADVEARRAARQAARADTHVRTAGVQETTEKES